jgi:hypothetical protein
MYLGGEKEKKYTRKELMLLNCSSIQNTFQVKSPLSHHQNRKDKKGETPSTVDRPNSALSKD